VKTDRWKATAGPDIPPGAVYWVRVTAEDRRLRLPKERAKKNSPIAGVNHFKALFRTRDVRDVCELYNSGESTRKIAARYRCNAATIRDLVSGESYPDVERPPLTRLRPRGKPSGQAVHAFEPEEARVIRRRAARGESLRKLAREYLVDRSTIRNLVSRLTYRDVPD
jgi:hypothetical protein